MLVCGGGGFWGLSGTFGGGEGGFESVRVWESDWGYFGVCFLFFGVGGFESLRV